MSIVLHIFPSSPRTFKVLSVAKYLNLAVDIKVVDLTKNEHRESDYFALNPNMRVPTLQDGDFILWESNAILQYLALKVPEAGLLPLDERGRIDVTRWQFWDLAHWDPACGSIISENLVKPFVMKSGEPDPAVIAKATGFFHRTAAVLDGQLSKRRFVTGDRLTLADFSLAAPLNYARVAGLPLESYGAIRRWYRTMSAMPAWEATMAANIPRALIAEPV